MARPRIRDSVTSALLGYGFEISLTEERLAPIRAKVPGATKRSFSLEKFTLKHLPGFHYTEGYGRLARGKLRERRVPTGLVLMESTVVGDFSSLYGSEPVFLSAYPLLLLHAELRGFSGNALFTKELFRLTRSLSAEETEAIGLASSLLSSTAEETEWLITAW